MPNHSLRARLTILKVRNAPNFHEHPVFSKNAHFGIFLVVFFPTTSSTFAKTQYYIYCTFHSTTTKINCATPSILKITKFFQLQTLLLIFEMHWDKSSVFWALKMHISQVGIDAALGSPLWNSRKASAQFDYKCVSCKKFVYI